MEAGDETDQGLSAEAAALRAGMVRESIDHAYSVEDERLQWEQGCVRDQLAAGCAEERGEVAGVAVRTIAPPGHPDGRGVIVYVHGGGLVAGSSITHRRFASRLVARTRRPVVVVDYRRLPEHTVDEAIDDVVAVVDAAAAPVLLAGDSSGAALALTAALRFDGTARIAGLVSFSGAFDATLSSPSIESADDPQLSRGVLTRWQSLLATVADLKSPAVSPMFAHLDGAPPALLFAGGDEVWRDDSVRLADRLRAAGVPTTLVVVPGMWHCWPMWGEFPEAEAALDHAASFMVGCLDGAGSGAEPAG